MSDWSSGYVTEIGYTHGVYKELYPHLLGFAGLIRGVEAPGLGNTPLRLLELGCGQGLSANIIAAANPHIDYTAIDFNPAHIASAKALAKQAATPNLHLREAAFAEVAAEGGDGDYDIIALHGIYTWVSAENRDHIIRIIRQRLRPGGMVYLSYNTYPGWSPVVPIRRLFTDTASDHPGAPIFERLDSAFAMFDRLKSVGARSIAASPGLGDRMDKARSMPRNYVAHEYLNGEWTIFYFGDVAGDMEKAKLSYVGSAGLLDHIDDINLTTEQRSLLGEIKDPVRRESIRDLIVNQGFRRDIFVRGAIPLGGLTAREKWMDLRFALTARLQNIDLKVKGVLGDADLQASVYEPILTALDQGPKTVRELVSMRSMAEVTEPRLQQALVVLTGKGSVELALQEDGENDRKRQTDLFNQAVMTKSKESNDINFLASPVTGGGVAVDRVGQLYLLARRENRNPVDFIWETFNQQGQRLIKDGAALVSEQENLEEIRKRIAAFQETTASTLAKLRIS